MCNPTVGHAAGTRVGAHAMVPAGQRRPGRHQVAGVPRTRESVSATGAGRTCVVRAEPPCEFGISVRSSPGEPSASFTRNGRVVRWPVPPRPDWHSTTSHTSTVEAPWNTNPVASTESYSATPAISHMPRTASGHRRGPRAPPLTPTIGGSGLADVGDAALPPRPLREERYMLTTLLTQPSGAITANAMLASGDRCSANLRRPAIP